MDAAQGSPMAFDLHSLFPVARTQTAAGDDNLDRGEHIVTVVAVGLAVLIVASIAVLMGMG
jgi:hypothetical protein